ncbi:hypothetical protein CUMW_107390 [Citrus unshiu]|uniref:Legume lectin domain-containing protein n=1 Tax=Citrus unshiu TaxID=55188 RepID=A0A2H5P6X4_CITUN|nr:hypothetical protein CUMW_107390 [Citrus unshiu]
MNFVKLLLLFLTIGLVEPTSALKFAFDGFNTSKLLLYGSAKLDSGAISLTQDTTFSIGRALYHAKIPLRRTNSFETSFTFSITPYKGQLPGHGLVFILVPSAGIQGAAASQHLGFLNRTNDGNPNNNVFGIEFDVFQNQEFNDINNNHVGLNVNSLTSLAAYEAGYWFQDNQNKTNWHFHELKLNNGKIYRVWIDYKDSFLSVSIAPAKMKKPLWPLLNVFIDLSDFFLDEMYAGFCAATGQLVENHKILKSFNHSALRQGGSKSQRVDLERRGTRESQAIPAPDANAELVLSMQKRKSQYNSKSRSEKFNPHPEEVASGFPIDPPRESQVAESSSGPQGRKNTDDAPKISTGADFSSVLVAARRSLLSEIIEKGLDPLKRPPNLLSSIVRSITLKVLQVLIIRKMEELATKIEILRPDSIIICILVHLDYGSSHKIHYSGPLIVLSGNVYQMLKDQDLQVQEAVRRGHVDKAKGFCRGGVFERWPVLTISYVYSLLKNLFAIHHLYFSFHSATT